MESLRSKHRIVAALCWAVLYFVSGHVSHQLNGPDWVTGYIWLPAGVTVGAFMLRPIGEWFALAGAFFIAQLALAVIEQSNYFSALLFAIDEIGAAALAVWLVRRVRFSLEGLYFLRSVILAALVASAFAALGGAAGYAVVWGAPFGEVGFVWAASDFVGVLLVVPVLASWSRFRAHRSGDHERFDLVLGIVSFALLVVVAFLIFDGDSAETFGGGVGYALTYIPLFLTVVVTVLLGGRTGSMSVLVLAIIVIVQTAQGDGPFAMLLEHRGHWLLEAQLYLGIASLLVLTVSTLKTNRERAHVRADMLVNNIELALASADQIAYVLDPTAGSIEWSGDVQRAFGQGADAAQLSDITHVLARLHPDDREALSAYWKAEAAGENRDAVTLRVVLPGGEIQPVTDRGAPLFYANVDVTVVAGVWQIERQPVAAGGV